MHIRMAVAHAGDPQREADEMAGVERAQHLAADLQRDDEQAQGDHVAVRETPYLFLHGERGMQFVATLAATHCNFADYRSRRFDSCRSEERRVGKECRSRW